LQTNLRNRIHGPNLKFLLLLDSFKNYMGSKREKYPEKCPWDLGPNQHLAKEENWTLRLGEAHVSFSKNKLDNNYFHVISNENEEQILAFRARLLYQKLLDKGFRLVE